MADRSTGRLVRVCRVEDVASLKRQLSLSPGEDWEFHQSGPIGRLYAVMKSTEPALAVRGESPPSYKVLTQTPVESAAA